MVLRGANLGRFLTWAGLATTGPETRNDGAFSLRSLLLTTAQSVSFREIAADLATWIPPPERYDLVACLYVHVAGSVPTMVRQLAAGVTTGGTLLLVGHQPIDPMTGEPTRAAGQVQVSVDIALAALEPDRWQVVVAEDRPREVAGSGVDAVVHARRLA